MKLIYILKTLRPYQWTKNLIIFAALLFSKNILDLNYVILNFWGFLIFCMLSGSVYLFNDVMDRKQDRLHPKKKNRAVASGKVKPVEALVAAFVIAAGTVTMAFHLRFEFGLSAVFYFLLIVFYSISFKKLVILDVLTLAIGFVVRAVAGGLLIQVEISDWLLIVTIFLALFLGFSKRRGELVNLSKAARDTRPILQSYTIPLLDQLITISTASTLMAYTLYTLAPQTIRKFGDRLWITIPVVVYIVFRYFFLVYARGQGSDPSRTLLRDMPLLVGVIIWIVLVFFLVYNSLLIT